MGLKPRQQADVTIAMRQCATIMERLMKEPHRSRAAVPCVMSKEEFEKQLAEAEARVADMDRVDGFNDRFLTTILSALRSGIQAPGTPLFDAYVMLRDVIRSGEVKIHP